MKCPFCFHLITPETSLILSETDSEGSWQLFRHLCTNRACRRNFYYLHQYKARIVEKGTSQMVDTDESTLIFPRISTREPADPNVPEPYAQDYNEACLILQDSPQASAALGRRCLQCVLRDVEKVKPGDLIDEIREVIDRKVLPSHLAENIDSIRVIGNFATHPIKSKSSGAIEPVEIGEAEWTLDTLEGLFDFYFVQPAITKKKRDILNIKLSEAGKPPLK